MTPQQLVAAIAADDRILDLLGCATPSALADDELNALMLAWRNEVEADPIPNLVDVDTALTAIQAGAA